MVIALVHHYTLSVFSIFFFNEAFNYFIHVLHAQALVNNARCMHMCDYVYVDMCNQFFCECACVYLRVVT